MRRRRRSPFLVLLAVALLAVAGVAAGRASLRRSMELPAGSANADAVRFVVAPGEAAGDIAARLEAKGLIRSGFAFSWAASSRDLDGSFRPGTFRVSPAMTGNDVLELLTSGTADLRVTIPEGFSLDQIAQRLSDAGIADAAAVRECAEQCVFDLPMLADRPEETGLEGYLFPDTYEFTSGTPAQEVLARLLRTMQSRIDPLEESIEASGRTRHEILTMASMLEKEVTGPRDRRIVAGILWERLERGIPLGVDATVLYALGEHKDFLTRDELQTDSPYNTRRFKGMPPGPICNPGLETIRAALEPEDSDWLFYLTDDQGRVHYARTNAEHEANKDRHLR